MLGLSLSGGGAKGAYEVGVLKHLAQHDVVPGFDAITGTSVGALIGSGLAMFPKKHFKEAVAYVEETFLSIGSDKDIYEFFFPKYAAGLWKLSLAKNDGLKKLLDKRLDPRAVRKSGVKLRVVSVDLLSGEPIVYTEEAPDLRSGVLRSSAFPVVFPPGETAMTLETDGGLREMAPVGEMIKMGCTGGFVILSQDPNRAQRKKREHFTNALDVALRSLELMSLEVIHNDVKMCRLVNQMVDEGVGNPKWRKFDPKVVYPSKELGDSLDFSPKKIREEIRMGQEDAAVQLRVQA
jgi:NTE family protein